MAWPEGFWLQAKLRDGYRIAGLRNTERKFLKTREVWKVVFHYELQPRGWSRDWADHVTWLPPELVEDFTRWMGNRLRRDDGIHINRGDSWQLYFTLELASGAGQKVRSPS